VNALPLQPIQTRKIYAEVIEQILGLVRSGHLRVGDQLPSEGQLTSLLGVSRSSVREALKALEVLGILESRTGVGSFVAQTSLADVPFQVLNQMAVEGSPWEIMEARLALEPIIARLAALRRTDEDLRRMRESVDKMSTQVADHVSTMDVDLQFHMLLAQACGNLVLTDCMHLISSRMQHRFWQAVKHTSLTLDGRPEAYLDHHRRILSAIERGDGQQSETVMLEHLLEVEAGFGPVVDAKGKRSSKGTRAAKGGAA